MLNYHYTCIIENELADMKEKHAQEIAKLRADHDANSLSQEHTLSLQLDKLTQHADIGNLQHNIALLSKWFLASESLYTVIVTEEELMSCLRITFLTCTFFLTSGSNMFSIYLMQRSRSLSLSTDLIIVEIQAEQNKLQEDYMTQLRDLGVDLTQYLRTKQPEPCTELIVLQK